MALDVYLTNACNLRCKYCFNLDREDAPRIPLEDVRAILSAAYRRGNRYVTITGGEPFLYKQIFDVLDHAHDLGFWINILSHGGLLDEAKVERLRRYWRLRIRISLDGADPETHDLLRGRGTFDHTLGKLDLLVGHGINTGVGMTVSEHNLASVDDVVKLCVDHGLAFVRFSPVARVKKGKAATVSASLHEALLESIIRLTVEHRHRLDWPPAGTRGVFSIDRLTTRRCMAGKLFFGITPDKKILPCPLISDHPDIPKVTFEDGESFARLGTAMDRIFDSMKDSLGGICGTCAFREVCYGGCLAEKLSFERRLDDEQPICTKKILESLVAKFDPADIDAIVKSWVFRLEESLEASESHACMRQAPYWSVNFAVRDRWQDTPMRYR